MIPHVCVFGLWDSLPQDIVDAKIHAVLYKKTITYDF